MKNSVTRRNFFRVGFGTLGALTASHSLAQICGTNTGEQALGPFFPREGTPELPTREHQDPSVPIYLANDNDLTFVRGRNGRAQGQTVYIRGQVLDETCRPIPAATIIIWQASSSGRYNHKVDAGSQEFRHPETGELIKRSLDPFFQYWGQAVTNENGQYLFRTIVPGFYPADLENGWFRPPHIHFMASATGLPQLVTQMYFQGNKIIDNDWVQRLNSRDFLLQSQQITDQQRAELIVHFKDDPNSLIADGLVGEFNIKLKRQ